MLDLKDVRHEKQNEWLIETWVTFGWGAENARLENTETVGERIVDRIFSIDAKRGVVGVMSGDGRCAHTQKGV